MSYIRRLASINIEGFIDYTLEDKVINKISKLRKQLKYSSIDAVSLIINSYGGQIIAARNIVDAVNSLKQDKQIPILCFAEQFCLNSANLILSAGNRAYASKFTIMGDYGYVYEGLDTKQLRQKYKLGIQRVTNRQKIDQDADFAVNNSVKLSDRNKIEQLLDKSTLELINGIISNRQQNMKAIGGNPQSVMKQVAEMGNIDPVFAAQIGLIDQVTTFNTIQYRDFPKAKILNLSQKLEAHLFLSLAQQLINRYRRLS